MKLSGTKNSGFSIQRDKIIYWFRSLSGREQILLGCAGLVIIAMLISFTFSSITTAFEKQGRELELAQRNLKAVNFALEKYTSLSTRKDFISAEFKNKSFEEDDSYDKLLAIIKNVSDNSDFRLQPKTTQIIDEVYRRKIFRATNIRISAFPKLIKLFEELTNEKTPFLVESFKIRKMQSFGTEVLQISDLAISAIEKKNS